MPRVIYLPLIGLVAAVAALGLVLGGRAATTTETEVIEKVAARYSQETGGGRSDCSARPAASAALWLVVSCGGHAYFVDPYGRVVDVARPGSAS